MKLKDLLELAFVEKKTNLAHKMRNEVTDEGKASLKTVHNTEKAIKNLFKDLEKLAFSLAHEERRKDMVAKEAARDIIQKILDDIK